MRFIDFFAGIGGMRRGLELAGHRCVGFCEWDKYATASYTSMHLITDEQREYLATLPLKQRQKEILKEEYRNGEWYSNDIRNVDARSLPDAECWCFGAPCFVKGTLVTTIRGLIPIEDIRAGDLVLTHTNTFQTVVKPMINVKQGIYTIKVQGSPITEVTGNHRFYVRYKHSVWQANERKYTTVFTKPEWKAVEDFDGTELIEFTINNLKRNIYDLTENDCWLIGRYVADGYLRNSSRKDRTSTRKETIICVGVGKNEEFEKHLSGMSYNAHQDNNVTKYHLHSKLLYGFCEMCGRGAENKSIPQFIMDLPREYLKAFLSGYMSGDGSKKDGVYNATTTSKVLAYQLGQCVEKVFHCSYSIYYTERPKKYIICNREVNQNDTYQVVFRPYSDKHNGYFLDGCLWQPIKNIKYEPRRVEIVYNMEVLNDNSYTANNMGVHNCQDFSLAGLRKGLDGDRSSLIREIFRLLDEGGKERKPEWLIYENVKGMLSSNRGLDFMSIICEMDRLGYDIEWQNLNTAWYLPQNRERIYTIGHIRNKRPTKIFPIEGADGENSVQQIGKQKSHRDNPNQYRVYDKDGCGAALNCMGGGGREPHIAERIPSQTFCDLQIGGGIKLMDKANTIKARYTAGVTNFANDNSGVAVQIPVSIGYKKGIEEISVGGGV